MGAIGLVNEQELDVLSPERERCIKSERMQDFESSPKQKLASIIVLFSASLTSSTPFGVTTTFSTGVGELDYCGLHHTANVSGSCGGGSWYVVRGAVVTRGRRGSKGDSTDSGCNKDMANSSFSPLLSSMETNAFDSAK